MLRKTWSSHHFTQTFCGVLFWIEFWIPKSSNLKCRMIYDTSHDQVISFLLSSVSCEIPMIFHCNLVLLIWGFDCVYLLSSFGLWCNAIWYKKWNLLEKRKSCQFFTCSQTLMVVFAWFILHQIFLLCEVWHIT